MANQTIIKAAQQRYTPVKTDYSGYIQGIASIAKGLIERKNQQDKQSADIQKNTKVDTHIKQWGNVIDAYRYRMTLPESNPLHVSREKGFDRFEGLKQETIKLEKIQEFMNDELNNGLSASVDPATENYIRSWKAGVFDINIGVWSKEQRGQQNEVAYMGGDDTWQDLEEMTNDEIREKYGDDGENVIKDLQQRKLLHEKGLKSDRLDVNPFFIMDENMETKVIGLDGEYVTVDQLEQQIMNIPNINDGMLVKQAISDFGDGVSKDDIESGVYNKKYQNTLDTIDDYFKRGVYNKKGDLLITPHNMKMAFMFDESQRLNINVGTPNKPNLQSKKVNFVDWYLSQNKYTESFGKQFENEIYKLSLYHEIENNEEVDKIKSIIAQDIIENDPNINEDLMEYVETCMKTFSQLPTDFPGIDEVPKFSWDN